MKMDIWTPCANVVSQGHLLSPPCTPLSRTPTWIWHPSSTPTRRWHLAGCSAEGVGCRFAPWWAPCPPPGSAAAWSSLHIPLGWSSPAAMPWLEAKEGQAACLEAGAGEHFTFFSPCLTAPNSPYSIVGGSQVSQNSAQKKCWQQHCQDPGIQAVGATSCPHSRQAHAEAATPEGAGSGSHSSRPGLLPPSRAGRGRWLHFQ